MVIKESIFPVRSWDSVISISTSYGEAVQVSNPSMGKISFTRNIQTGSIAHTASHAMGTTIFFWGVKLTTQPHLVLRLRMS
jgi:hypothetical protein